MTNNIKNIDLLYFQGLIDVITISLIVVFVMGVAVGIGYMIYRFGM